MLFHVTPPPQKKQKQQQQQQQQQLDFLLCRFTSFYTHKMFLKQLLSSSAKIYQT
jgi:hypothetical protein